MVEDPSRHLAAFAEAGADMLVVHAEADHHLQRTLDAIRALGCKAGVALNPGTDVNAVRWLVADLDMLLIMSVNPGFSGQAFIPASFAKLRAARRLLDENGGGNVLIQVDGGVAPKTPALWWRPGPMCWFPVRHFSVTSPMARAWRPLPRPARQAASAPAFGPPRPGNRSRARLGVVCGPRRAPQWARRKFDNAYSQRYLFQDPPQGCGSLARLSPSSKTTVKEPFHAHPQTVRQCSPYPGRGRH